MTNTEQQIIAAMMIILPNEPMARYLRVKVIINSRVVLVTSSFDLYLAINKDSTRGDISEKLSKMFEQQVDVVTHWSEQ